MPKPLKKGKPKDENQSAFSAVERIIQLGESETAQSFDAQFRAHMATLGRKGGRASGAKRMQNLSAAQRSEIALRAATKRWEKERAKKRSK